MMAGLLSLYQQDVASSEPNLAAPARNVVDWVDGCKDYLDRLRAMYGRIDGVSARQKRLAAGCLNLATQSLQLGTTVAAELAHGNVTGDRPVARGGIRSFGIFVVSMFAAVVLNIWLLDATGALTVLVLLSLFVILHWGDVGALQDSLRWGGKSLNPDNGREPPGLAPAVLDVRSAVEMVVRRTDEIVSLSEAETGVPTAQGLKASTLEFFQDILEAKLSNDQDYAFKKISRTINQVLAAEGISVVTDVKGQMAMFRLDTVVDERRASELETIRPALAHDAKCLLPGYARRFVSA